jgi:poly(3-hydroxybutyrate) depolymerase
MLETDIPAARRLQALEDVIETLKNKSGGWLRGQRGDLWASVALAGTTRTVPVRLYIPPIQDETKPLPLVVALHGAGGSENMFFDGYGDGAIVRLCRRRGWLLVAPRSGMLGAAPVDELLDALVAELPVDRTRVFLVGHSMGAAQAVSIAAHRPERYAAVAALGGGGRFGKTSDAFRALPFFIGVGTDDFLLRGAQELKQALERAGTARVEVREYDKIEHLAIVQVALGDVFAFFDTVNRGVAPRQ